MACHVASGSARHGAAWLQWILVPGGRSAAVVEVGRKQSEFVLEPGPEGVPLGTGVACAVQKQHGFSGAAFANMQGDFHPPSVSGFGASGGA